MLILDGCESTSYMEVFDLDSSSLHGYKRHTCARMSTLLSVCQVTAFNRGLNNVVIINRVGGSMCGGI